MRARGGAIKRSENCPNWTEFHAFLKIQILNSDWLTQLSYICSFWHKEFLHADETAIIS